MAIFTKKGWRKSDLDLTEYIDEPCEIDEKLYNYILEAYPPHYLGDLAQQGLEPEDSYESENGKKIFTYMTVKQFNGKFFYLGILPEFRK